MSSLIETWTMKTSPALIGMVHLDALPGSPNANLHLDEVVERAVHDARILAATGFDAIMMENYGDTPFFKTNVPGITIAAMTRCAMAIRHALPHVDLGINVLRNDGLTALNIAYAVGAKFIRVNVLSGAMLTDQGLIEGCSADLMRHRRFLNSDIEVWADIGVKHAVPPAPVDLGHQAQDTAHRGHASALIVSGNATGDPTQQTDVDAVRRAVPALPIVIGSGACKDTVGGLNADAVIVGTALKVNGRINQGAAEVFVRAARASQ